MHTQTIRRRSTALLSGLALAASLAAVSASPADAGASSTESRQDFTFFYANTDGIAAFSGPVFEEGCLGIFDDQDVHVVRPSDTRTRMSAHFEDELRLYDLTEIGVANPPELLDLACAAVANGEEAPQAFAVGTGRVQARFDCTHQPGSECFTPNSEVDLRNTVKGTVIDQEGNELHVRTTASLTLMFPENGPPIEEGLVVDVVIR